MDIYNKLPYDISEYIAKKEYNKFRDRVKTKYTIYRLSLEEINENIVHSHYIYNITDFDYIYNSTVNHINDLYNITDNSSILTYNLTNYNQINNI